MKGASRAYMSLGVLCLAACSSSSKLAGGGDGGGDGSGSISPVDDGAANDGAMADGALAVADATSSGDSSSTDASSSSRDSSSTDSSSPTDASSTTDSSSAGDSSSARDSSSGGDSSPGGDASSRADSGGQDAAKGDSGAGDSGSASADRFPSSSIIYEDISSATLDPNSTTIISNLSSAGGWGSGNFQIDFSITILHADGSVVPRAFTLASGYYAPDCDVTPVPIPPGGNAEGSTNYACDTSYHTSGQGDCHVIVYQGTRLYELYNTNINGGTATGSPFTTICEVVWDLTRDYWQSGTTPYSRGDQCTSADAAGMPIAPLLATGAELSTGVVPHALRFILPNAEIQGGIYLHPGTHIGAPSAGAMMPPYAARFRLKSTFDVASLPSAGARAVAVAMQTYGMFLDDGGNIPLTLDASAAAYIGSHDLAALQVTDFEMVASPDPAVPYTGNCTRTQLTQ
jgi:hypothetical protein